MYAKYFKRIIDFTLSLFALIVLSPVLLMLVIVGAIAMSGNPFFTQLRPGQKDKDGNEKIFRLIKFRTMRNKKDKDGNLLATYNITVHVWDFALPKEKTFATAMGINYAFFSEYL